MSKWSYRQGVPAICLAKGWGALHLAPTAAANCHTEPDALCCACDQDVAALHPGHSAASVRALLPRLHYFEEGTCIVHHLFGAEVTEAVRASYGDAYLTAHFEVPCWFYCYISWVKFLVLSNT